MFILVIIPVLKYENNHVCAYIYLNKDRYVFRYEYTDVLHKVCGVCVCDTETHRLRYIYVYMYVYIYTYIFMCIYKYIYIYIYI
jgi:hypothetical protein